ncbi:MAG: M23 family metallopeptidase, partial [Saprospiraceae bacterium]|nr:M23 family metallopeptidase [Saprospiraceae bacterium]
MSETSDKQKSLKSRVSDQYRLVILDDDTLKELKTARISILGFTLSMVAILILIAGLTYLIIAFTPLRYTVPGYAEIENNKVYMELYQRLEMLEKELDAQKIYTDGLKNMLNPSGQEIDANIPLEDLSLNNGVDDLTNFFFHPPLRGEISASFNRDINHLGVDVIAPKNTPVKSILDGKVIHADWSIKNGNTLSIQHPNNIISTYKHNSSLLKKVGDQV